MPKAPIRTVQECTEPPAGCRSLPHGGSASPRGVPVSLQSASSSPIIPLNSPHSRTQPAVLQCEHGGRFVRSQVGPALPFSPDRCFDGAAASDAHRLELQQPGPGRGSGQRWLQRPGEAGSRGRRQRRRRLGERRAASPAAAGKGERSARTAAGKVPAGGGVSVSLPVLM